MSTREPLGPAFRALFTGALISNIGDGIRLAALPLLATTLTTSPLLISTVTAAQYLAWVSFAPLGGALVDRSNRRRTILVTQLWRGIVMAGLAVLVLTGHAAIWHVCVLAFVITVGEILVDPATVALVPTLVDDENLDRANSRIASAEIVTNDFAGGPVGAAMFTFAPWLPFLLDAATYLGSLLPFRYLPVQEPPRQVGPHAGASILAEAREGFAWLRRHRVLGPLTVSYVVYYFAQAAPISLLVVLATDELDGSNAAFGVILAAGAAGAFVGTLVASPAASRFGPRMVLSSTVGLQALGLLATSLSGSVVVLAAVWFLTGVPAGVMRPVSRSLQQRLTPNHLLGRVNVTSRIFTRGVIVLGALTAGTTAAISGVRSSFFLAGVVQFVAASMVWYSLTRLSDTDRPTSTSTPT